MSKPDSEDSGEEGEVEIEVVDDPESYIQTRRLQDIFEARKDVRDQRMIAKEHEIAYSDRPKEARKARRLYRASVENYLSELRPLFLSDELGKQYWFNLDLGSVSMDPSVYNGTYGDSTDVLKYDDGDKTYVVTKEPETKYIDLNGLNAVFELAEPVTASWTLKVKAPGRGRGPTGLPITEKFDIGFTNLDAIVNEANSYLRERGIELDPEEGLPEDELQL
jgi:hypothetical protein